MSTVVVNNNPGPHEPEAFSLEVAVDQIEALLQKTYPISKRSMALLLLQEDVDILRMVEQVEPAVMGEIRKCVEHAKGHYQHPLGYVIASLRQDEAMAVTSRVLRSGKEQGTTFAEGLSRLMVHPVFGLGILFLVLYWGLYKLVGEFGAGTLVDLLEENLFNSILNPWMVDVFSKYVHYAPVRDLFVGEYGVFTLGIRYAIAIILPIVTVFFIVFSIIEDTGYLPRLALLIDRLFKKLGLSGRAVIPMVLGFGCSTMATMVTRTLPTRRERIIATLLLALAVPCSAQLGVIMALLSGNAMVMALWLMVMVGVFLLIGFLAARIMPGERPSFYMEVPPIRWPKLSNVVIKTMSRVWWYCLEVIPLFVLASVIIWLAQLLRLFDAAKVALKVPLEMMGLPQSTATVFIYGFFRRDYGAAGLYDLSHNGGLTNLQLLTACVALSLFLPCVAQFIMNVKERGWKVGVGISVFILFFSFAVAAFVNWVIVALGVRL